MSRCLDGTIRQLLLSYCAEGKLLNDVGERHALVPESEADPYAS